ncbi:hypothetical protein HK097_009077 [Rhizophlyctis rosea]|uniref:Transcription elongation factor 1 homolog n=1 Tax=Rhizophlyctis rosea TaxID=64517 RepID=A0AAD5SCH9_9FUNG|nr:hypothetical protein HK097_009077 [Rhizophlyctis rosea]
MGKRKAARKPVAKAKVVLSKTFLCLYCNHEDSVNVKVDKKDKLANLLCKVCGVSWQTVVQPPMDEPIDVYHAWLDAAEETNRIKDSSGPNVADYETALRRSTTNGSSGGRDRRKDSDDEVDEDEDLPPTRSSHTSRYDRMHRDASPSDEIFGDESD